jgi:hypothetical protein
MSSDSLSLPRGSGVVAAEDHVGDLSMMLTEAPGFQACVQTAGADRPRVLPGRKREAW